MRSATSSGASSPRAGSMTPPIPSSSSGSGSGSGSTESGPSPLVVGTKFVKQYYKVLSTTPDQIHRFYQPKSVLSQGVGSQPTQPACFETLSQNSLKDRFAQDDSDGIEETTIRKCSVIRFEFEHGAIDAQLSVNGGILLVVTGHVVYLDNEEDEENEEEEEVQRRKAFVHTFFLGSTLSSSSGGTTKRSYYVHNDILRFLHDDEEKTVVASNTTSKNKNIILKEQPPAVVSSTPPPSPPEKSKEEAPGGGVEETKEPLPEEEEEEEAEVEASKEMIREEQQVVEEQEQEQPQLLPIQEVTKVEVKETEVSKTAFRDGVTAKAAEASKESMTHANVVEPETAAKPAAAAAAAAKPTPGSWASLVASGGGSAPGTPTPGTPVRASAVASPVKPKTSPVPPPSQPPLTTTTATPSTAERQDGSGRPTRGTQHGHGKRDPDCTLVIKNIDTNATESDVIGLFEPYAGDAKVVGITVSGHKAIAFIDYNSPAPVLAAVQKHQKEPFRLHGRVLDIYQKTLEQRGRRGSGRGGERQQYRRGGRSEQRGGRGGRGGR